MSFDLGSLVYVILVALTGMIVPGLIWWLTGCAPVAQLLWLGYFGFMMLMGNSRGKLAR